MTKKDATFCSLNSKLEKIPVAPVYTLIRYGLDKDATSICSRGHDLKQSLNKTKEYLGTGMQP